MLPQRTVTAGDTLELLVLAMSGGELLGVDLASGSFVRVADPGGPPLRPYDVVSLELGGDEPVWSPHAPELVETTSPSASPVGHLPARRAERWVRALVDPPGEHLLGFRGPAVPFWTLRGERPSMAIVRPTTGIVVRPAGAGGGGYRCSFTWRGQACDLPLFDSRLLALLEARGAWRCSGDALTHLLGYRPERVLVTLSAPFRGHCYKVAAGLLSASLTRHR